MPSYIVSSRGVPIGVTDLGFTYVLPDMRMGWFHPNAEGERLMPLFSAPSEVLRTSVGRDARERAADIAEATQRVQALELRLHREDGSPVPTVDIGIRDTEQMLRWARDAEAEMEAEKLARGWQPGDDADEAFDGELEMVVVEPGDLEPAFEDMLDDVVAGMQHRGEWSPDAPLAGLPRYQVAVILEERATPEEGSAEIAGPDPAA